MYDVLCIMRDRKDLRKYEAERSPENEKTSFPPRVGAQVAPGDHVRVRPEKQNAERRYSALILFQVRDLAAKTCGEPHIAPSWEIAKASLGAMLAKTSELAERAHSIRIELCGLWDPSEGVKHTLIADIPGQAYEFGDVCLAEFRAACAKEENERQEEAENAE